MLQFLLSPSGQSSKTIEPLVAEICTICSLSPSSIIEKALFPLYHLKIKASLSSAILLLVSALRHFPVKTTTNVYRDQCG